MDTEIDILDRESTIDQLHKFIKYLSESRKHGCFAIDGKWGSGKTFVIERLKKILECEQNESTNDNKFQVFYYNCWKYDYYEEPSVAIISSMIDNISKEKTKGIEQDVQNALHDIGKIVETIASDFIKNKIGIDVVEILKQADKENNERESQKYAFDELYAFNKTLENMRNKIIEIAKYRTVVILVDELDRCIPSYAIKVLERLHHIFGGIHNVIVVLAVDGTQLENSVRDIFGADVDTERYLKKFINFKFYLDNGKTYDPLFEKYDYYFGKFEKSDSIRDFIKNVISYLNIEVRNIEKVIEKINIMHALNIGG